MVHHVPEFKARTCPVCGVTVNGKISPLANRIHVASLIHRRGPRLRQLLQSGATLETIGTELGVTRERIRQLAQKINCDRMEYVHQRKAAKKAEQTRANLDHFISTLPHTQLGRFLEAAAKHSLQSELVPYKDGKSWRANRAMVNGKHVLVKGAETIYNSFGTPYIRVVGTVHVVDLLVYELPDRRWAFFKPEGSLGRRTNGHTGNSTMFTLYDVQPGDKGYTYHCNHNHREAIEAWHLLAEDTGKRSHA